MAADGSSNILGNVNGSSVLAQKNFFVVVFVLALAYNISNVNAHGAVFCLKEYALFKAFKDFVLALKVGF